MRILRENFASLIVWLTAFEKLGAVHGKSRWDIAMIFLCEKDWLNALMAPPVTCRIKRRQATGRKWREVDVPRRTAKD
jgi:hypothetical protein